MESPDPIIVITGIDSGIGYHLAQKLVQHGFQILATYLDHNPFPCNKQILAYQVDFRTPGALDQFCSVASERCEPLHVSAVIANAGVALGGPAEDIPLEMYRECMDINYFGVVKTVQTFIPHLTRSKGRIIINGSLAGQVAMPFMSPYTASKFALEGFTDSLRREMNPFGVKTILLEPGAVATPIWSNALEQDTSFISEKYMPCLYRFRDKFIKGGLDGMSSDKAADKIIKILESKHPRTRYIIADNPLMSKLISLLPNRLLDRAVISMFDMDYESD